MMINHLDELRQYVKEASWPLSSTEWPIELNEDTNCLAFALGLPFADVNRDTFRFPKYSNLEEELKKWFEDLELDYRKINSNDEAKSDEIIIQCFEFISPITNRPDYHVIRRNSDGTWEHKPGWKEAPRKITKWNDSSFWYKHIPHSLYTFAIKRL